MNRQTAIILTDGANHETWGSLKDLCNNRPQFRYDYLKRLKFPITYKGCVIIKTPFRSLNGVKINKELW